MLNDLKELIAIESVKSQPEEHAPFGRGCRQALDWFLQKAESYGLKTGELDGYAGWAEYGDGQECVAALCHLDIVPAGEGWASDPFTLLIENGNLYGRGVADDKGAAIMCLHALKEIKEKSLKLNKRIRVIVGLNEEHGSGCMKYYVANGGEIPKVSFVPDSDFPIINSEKGILHLGIRIPLDKFFQENIAHISGGGSINVVPDKASISIFKDSPLSNYLTQVGGGTISSEIFSQPEIVGSILAAGHRIEDYFIKIESDVITIETVGTAGHAMAPHKSDNAIWKLFSFLDGLSDKSPILKCFNEYFCTPMSAEKLGIYKSDPQSGDVTISMGIIEVDENSLYFTLDLRLNITSNHEEVQEMIAKAWPPKSKVEVLRYSPNLFIDCNDTLITTLLGAYKDVTGLDAYCMHCGGGTYARELPNAVAFGPTFPGLVTNIHKPDECFPVEAFYKAAKVYKEAFIRLAKI